MATILQFLVFFIMLIGGILLLGVAFNTPIMPGLVFVAGIVVFSLAFIIPIVIGRRGMR
ncbi:MAG TPA: hypothetical protein PKM36_07130 [Propionibacteriaceae bacterium]|nr:hypothetical protein [Propionibacteriaceae bacterium]